MAALVLLEGGGESNGSAFPIGTGCFVIGRSRGAWVQLVDATVSRRHCFIQFEPHSRSHWLHDRRSKNKTLINGLPLEDSHRLVDGDLITLGAIEIKYTTETVQTGAHTNAVRKKLNQEDEPTVTIQKSKSVRKKRP